MKLTWLRLCSAATAKPKAIRSRMKTMMSKSLEAIEVTTDLDLSLASSPRPASFSLYIEVKLSNHQAV